MYWLLRFLVRLIARVYLNRLFKVEGLENVPRSGPLLICPNHISTVDPAVVPAVVPRADTWSMAKSEYFATNRPLTRWVFTRYHAFPVVRHTADRAALRRALEILAAGEGLILYPEGTRVDDAQLKQPEPGVGFLAQRSGTLVLPVALTGTNDCFPKGAWFPRRVRVTVRFGNPFRLEEQRPDGSRVTREEAAAA